MSFHYDHLSHILFDNVLCIKHATDRLYHKLQPIQPLWYEAFLAAIAAL